MAPQAFYRVVGLRSDCTREIIACNVLLESAEACRGGAMSRGVFADVLIERQADAEYLTDGHDVPRDRRQTGK